MSGVLAVAWPRTSGPDHELRAVVGQGARLGAALGVEAAVLLVGQALGDDLGASVGRFGVARTLLLDAPPGLAAPVVETVATLVAREDVGVVLLAGHPSAPEVGGALAVRLDASLALDVDRLEPRDGLLVAGGLADPDGRVRELGLAGPRVVVVARRGAFELPRPGAGTARVERIGAGGAATGVPTPSTGVPDEVEEADVLVSGGRGLGGPEAFRLCEALAGELGGVVVATRAVVDAGWYPYSAQVGQTGRTAAPRLVLAAGVSGAPQHLAGIRRAGRVVAINRDPEAPIFAVSDLGVVGDVAAILPHLVEAVRTLRRARGADVAERA